ncbi:MAG: tRNA guanosine(34) transglycosylase Tgt [Candidatus Moraniibacteriota bacterium]
MFKITSSLDQARSGLIRCGNREAPTPFFMPIATRGAVKLITMKEVENLGFEVVLGNTYHLWLKPGDDLVKKAGGIRGFSGWEKMVLTDSGGFQIFSLGEKAEKRFGKSGVKLTEEGVYFTDPTNGNRHFMSPEDSVEIQLKLGSDIIMCLDECPPYPCDYDKAKKSLELTTRWAKRCKEYFNKRVGDNENRPLLFGIVQGSVYQDLREESARQLTEIDFDGYAIGGVAVGEPREALKDILKWVIPHLPEKKPRYLMGLGRPEEIASAVLSGVDMFDCVIPTREGRHGRIFTWQGKDFSTKELKSGNFYQTLNLANEKFKEDFSSLDENCNCPVCSKYSKAYLRHLFNVGEPLAGKMASAHNLSFYHHLIQMLKNNIQDK